VRGLDELPKRRHALHIALKAATNNYWLLLLHLLSRSRRKSNELRTDLPANAGFDRSVPCVELEAPLGSIPFFVSTALVWPRQRFQLSRAVFY
jgi:hypothetical protein